MAVYIDVEAWPGRLFGRLMIQRWPGRLLAVVE